MEKVYYWSSYWQQWNEIVGYDEETEEIIFKSVTPLNGDAKNDTQLGKINRNEYMKIEMKFLSLKVVKRDGKKYDDFCKEVFDTCREAYRVLHFGMNIPNKRFDKTYCIRR